MKWTIAAIGEIVQMTAMTGTEGACAMKATSQGTVAANELMMMIGEVIVDERDNERFPAPAVGQ